MRKPKFKLGDKVECVKGKSKGSGWKLGHRFEIIQITERNTSSPIYWKGINDCGVREDSLKLANELKKYKEGYYKK